jgi:hypothetical protein
MSKSSNASPQKDSTPKKENSLKGSPHSKTNSDLFKKCISDLDFEEKTKVFNENYDGNFLN